MGIIMRICIDLDGTICDLRKGEQSYADVLPKKGVKEFIDRQILNGHTIIIHTARNMQTQNHNVGKVLKNIGQLTLTWLDKHQIQYHEIFFGKPNADITIDDRVLRFESWDKITDNLLTELSKSE